jgi:hypothetical protein
MRYQRHTLSALMSLCLGLAGCVTDHSVDDWQREKLKEELEQLQPIAGTYRGVLKSQDQELGALELAFTPQIRVIPGGPSEKAEGQPTLAARLIFEDQERRVALTSADSFFEPLSGKFEISLSLTRSSGRTEQITVGGYLWKTSLEGTLEVAGSPENRAQFSLSREESSPLRDIAQKLSTKPWFAVPGNFVEGITRFVEGKQRAAKLVILEPETSPEEAFLNRFAPLRVVQFSMNYGDAFRLVHEGALWDERLRKLTGRSRIIGVRDSQESIEVSTECLSPSPSEWTCTHDVAGLGRTATSIFPVVGATDPSDSRGGLRYVRQGSTRLSQRELNRVWLQVIRSPKDRSNDIGELFVPSPEKSATISLQFGLPDSSEEERVTVVFEKARIDLDAQTLDAVSIIRTGGSAGGAAIEVRLRCTNFVVPGLHPPNTPMLDATCRYTSTQLSEPIQILFLKD